MNSTRLAAQEGESNAVSIQNAFRQSEAEERALERCCPPQRCPPQPRSMVGLRAAVSLGTTLAVFGCTQVEELVEKSKVRQAVESATGAGKAQQSAQTLNQAHAALHAHVLAKKGDYPAAGSEESDSKQLLSWRVQVLPYLDADVLYNQIQRQEAWDSPANSALQAQIPPAYQSPHFNSPEHKTVILAPILPPRTKGNTVLQKDAAQSLMKVTDGTSNVILLVEADADVAAPWMRPSDLPFDEANPKRGLGNLIPGGFSAAFVDGSVRFISNKIDEKTLAGMMQRDDRQQLGEPFDDHSQVISPKTVGPINFR